MKILFAVLVAVYALLAVVPETKAQCSGPNCPSRVQYFYAPQYSQPSVQTNWQMGAMTLARNTGCPCGTACNCPNGVCPAGCPVKGNLGNEFAISLQAQPRISTELPANFTVETGCPAGGCSSSGSPGFGSGERPVIEAIQAKVAARPVLYRLTHPFGGHFRR